ncbi:MAG: hypothetical protein ACRC1U_02730 [Vibrionaceae bacterium]
MPMTRFLMQIGRENPPPPDDGAEAAESLEQIREREAQQVKMALDIGDIRQIGTTPVPRWERAFNRLPALIRDRINRIPKLKIEPKGNYPIYQFFGEEGGDDIKFTLDPSLAQAACASIPPRIIHLPGEVHQGMWPALWGAFCYDHQTEETDDNYQALLRGIEVRYSGDN